MVRVRDDKMGKAVGWTGDGSDFKSDLDVHAVEFLRKGLERQGEEHWVLI